MRDHDETEPTIVGDAYCPRCDDDHEYGTDPHGDADGTMRSSDYVETDDGRYAPQDCARCEGTGEVRGEDCARCEGTGEVADRTRRYGAEGTER